MAAPPTPEQVERQLSSPSPPVYSPIFNQLAAAGGSQGDYIGRPIPSASRRNNSFSSYGPSDSDELSTSPCSPPPAPGAGQLSAISELSDALNSGSEDSDSSSIGRAPSGSRSSQRPLASPAMSRVQEQDVRSSRSLEQLRSGMQESVAVRSGYLMKKGKRRKAWKKRWFVLRGGQLAMYKNEKEYQLLKLIPVIEIHTCAPIEHKKHTSCFAITTPQRTYYIKASSDREMQDWCTLVNQSKEEAKHASTVTSLDTPRGSDSLSRTDEGTTPKGVGSPQEEREDPLGEKRKIRFGL